MMDDLFSCGSSLNGNGFLSVFNGCLAGFADFYFLIARFLLVQNLYAACSANRTSPPAPREQFPNSFASMRF
jgi:hypothetical protein